LKQHNLNFKPLEINDLNYIFDWFKLFEINQWYAQRKNWSMVDIEAKYKPRLIDEEFLPSFIIKLNSKNIGFIQYYPLAKTTMPEGLSFADALKLNINLHSSVGIDLFIGELTLIGQGLGKTIIRQFIQEIIPKNYTIIFIDPAKENIRAVKAYKKVGFKEYSRQDNDKICLMYAKREELDITVFDTPNDH
jgi:RimJ/RimL family protein N-acetyltransferase